MSQILPFAIEELLQQSKAGIPVIVFMVKTKLHLSTEKRTELFNNKSGVTYIHFFTFALTLLSFLISHL